MYYVVCMHVYTYVCVNNQLSTYVCMHEFMYVCSYVCMYVCMYVCFYVCVCCYVCAVEVHLSGLIWTSSNPDMQNNLIIGVFLGNRLY